MATGTYTKTTWLTGDVITATKLNNVEKQFDEAKYIIDQKLHGTTGHKHTGADGDGPKLQLVGSLTLTYNSYGVTISGLDINSHGGYYKVLIETVFDTSSSGSLSVYVNGSSSNYQYSYFRASGNSVFGHAYPSSGILIYPVSGSRQFVIDLDVTLLVEGSYKNPFIAGLFQGWGEKGMGSVYCTDGVSHTNITSLTFNTHVYMKAGTRIRIFRRET